MAKKYTQQAAVAIMLKNNLKPLEPYSSTQHPWKSKCLVCNKTVEPRLQKVLSRGHQCKYCSGHIVDPINAIELLKSKGFTPKAKYPGANKPWKSQCNKCKKVFSVNYTSVKLGFGCKFCSKRAVDPKDAVAAMKLRGFKTLEDFPGATKDWKVQCTTCNKTFYTKFHSLKTRNKCKYCSGVAVDETEILRILAKLKLKPLERYKSAKTPWRCKCLKCGHTVQPTWMRIKAGRGHCAYCANRRVDIKYAAKIMRQLDLKPIVDFPGSNKPWKCICLKCKEFVSPRWSGLLRGQGGCSNCADYGLNYTKAGYIYLIEHTGYKSLKIGIGNSYKGASADDRLIRHSKKGWVLLKKYDFQKLEDAFLMEQNLLKWIRGPLNLEIFLSPKEMPHGGWTETFDSRMIDKQVIIDKMNSEKYKTKRK